jgi:hypothetical protein
MKSQSSEPRDDQRTGCGVNSTFNFAVGGLAIVAAVVIGYLAIARWW